MSYIPTRKMPHITAASGEFDPETGKIIHLHPEATPSLRDRMPGAPKLSDIPNIGWIAGGAGLAAAVLGAALFALRSSTPKKPSGRARTATKRTTATRRRKPATAKRKTAA